MPATSICERLFKDCLATAFPAFPLNPNIDSVPTVLGSRQWKGQVL